MSSMRPRRTNRCRALTVLLSAVGIAACELRDPVVVTYEDSDPVLMVQGARVALGTGISTLIGVEFTASDEGVDNRNYYGTVDETGDIGSYSLTINNGVVLLAEARELTRMAIDRARGSGNDAIIRSANAYHGWSTIELGRRVGDQPLTARGPEQPLAEIYAAGIESFDNAIQLSVGAMAQDSIHQMALAGRAWTLWELGRQTGDSQLLSEAVDDATSLLAMNPVVDIRSPTPGSPSFPLMLGWLSVAEGFEDIPGFWNEPLPPGETYYRPSLMDADGLRLIVADIQLGFNDLPGARDALRTVSLLPVNHVGLAGRDPQGAPMTDAEVDAFVDSLDAAGVRNAIDELWRENFFAQGRRNVGPNGPIHPMTLPPN